MLYVLLLLIGYTDSAWAKSRILAFEAQGVQYFAVLLDKGEPSSALRTSIYRAAERFMVDQYVARGTLDPVKDAGMIHALRTTETIDDGRSQLLAIFEAKNGALDLAQMRGMIRVAHQTEEKMLLPYEERLVARGMRQLPPNRIRENQDVLLPSSLEIGADGGAKPTEYSVRKLATGAHVELKNFVIAKESKHNLFPLIMQLIEGAGWVSESELKTMFKPKVFSLGKGVRNAPDDFGLPEGKAVAVSEIYIETGVGRLQRYYERLGFETVMIIEKDPDVATAATALMRIERSKLKDFLKKIRTRPGQELLTTARFRELPKSEWEKLLDRTVSCMHQFSSL